MTGRGIVVIFLKPPLVIIADDLTGAADAALPFWRAGRRAVVIMRPDTPLPTNADVVAICTHTRAMTEGEASRIVSTLAERLPRNVAWFKKIDSTLRGWVGAEAKALQAADPDRRILFAPAYPSRGRTWDAQGVYRVDNIPLAQTEFAEEIIGLSEDSRLDVYLLRHFGATLPDEARATTAADLNSAVAHVDGPVLWVGSSGLGLALASPQMQPPPAMDTPERLSKAKIVVAAGSRRGITARQVESLERALGGATAAGVMRAPAGAYDPAQERSCADDLGRRAAAAARAQGEGGLILTGGDIAAATLRHLGVNEAEVVGEVEDGLPVLRAGAFHFVTKAGGFGDAFSLVRAYQRLSESAR